LSWIHKMHWWFIYRATFHNHEISTLLQDYNNSRKEYLKLHLECSHIWAFDERLYHWSSQYWLCSILYDSRHQLRFKQRSLIMITEWQWRSRINETRVVDNFLKCAISLARETLIATVMIVFDSVMIDWSDKYLERWWKLRILMRVRVSNDDESKNICSLHSWSCCKSKWNLILWLSLINYRFFTDFQLLCDSRMISIAVTL